MPVSTYCLECFMSISDGVTFIMLVNGILKVIVKFTPKVFLVNSKTTPRNYPAHSGTVNKNITLKIILFYYRNLT